MESLRLWIKKIVQEKPVGIGHDELDKTLTLSQKTIPNAYRTGEETIKVSFDDFPAVDSSAPKQEEYALPCGCIMREKNDLFWLHKKTKECTPGKAIRKSFSLHGQPYLSVMYCIKLSCGCHSLHMVELNQRENTFTKKIANVQNPSCRLQHQKYHEPEKVSQQDEAFFI